MKMADYLKRFNEKLRERYRSHPEVFGEKLSELILPIIRDKRFLHSWRGTFMTMEFDEESRKQVIEKLSELNF